MDSLAARVQRPFDENLKAELYHILRYKRATWLHRIFQQHPFQRRMYLQTAVYGVDIVDASECPANFPTTCKVVRTKCQVLQPIRSDILFDYVGDLNGMQSYPYASSENVIYSKHSKYSKELPYHFYSDKYIYVYNAPDLKAIKVRFIPDVPFDGVKCGCLDIAQSDCFDENADFQLPQDIISLIVGEILSVELRAEGPFKMEDTETIQVDKQEMLGANAKK